MSTVTKVMRLFVLMAFLTGCGGRAPNPIATIIPGDSSLVCDDIIGEMSTLDARARKLLGKQSNKTGKNIGLGIAGFFVIVPWFFMDFSEADRIEAEAMRDRYHHLERISRKQKCEI